MALAHAGLAHRSGMRSVGSTSTQKRGSRRASTGLRGQTRSASSGFGPDNTAAFAQLLDQGVASVRVKRAASAQATSPPAAPGVPPPESSR